METRDGHGIEVRHEPDLVVTRTGPQVVPPTERPPARRRRLAALIAAGLLGVVAVAVAVALWAGGEEEVVARPPAAPAAKPADPAPLGLAVNVPDHVVAGEVATLTVRWTDGQGVFGGTTEEWGDGVGTSSLSAGRCEPGAAPQPSGGSYDVRHTWSEPGTYTVVLGVATYTCDAGTPTEEQATKTVTVHVGAAR